jgi:threonine/homoserine/homoserine lactone efflux protein
MLIAHASHWAVTVSYMAPVAGFLIWLGVVTVRQRRRDRLGRAREQERPSSSGH